MNVVRRPEQVKRRKSRFASLVIVQVRELSRKRHYIVTLSLGGLGIRVRLRLVIMLGRSL